MKPRSASSRFVAWTGGLTALVGLALLGWVLSSLSELHRTLAEISAPLANAVLIALIVVLVAILSLGLRFLWVAARAGDRTAETQSPGGARARGAAYASVAPVQAFAAGYASRVIGEATKVYLRNGASWGPAGPKTVIQSILDTLDKDSAGWPRLAQGSRELGGERSYRLSAISHRKARQWVAWVSV